ncbi:ankyrin repeat domain-containing protein, putative [Perkinsus marinus ATCC 50983]|uniref:Ankyrin repeat domain-containing protein, putative n=1 Tax=Perkinsus marinus (strain ATCC 50983 / TXsc) TaxID=423536 RepID=C5KG92_PERM5|nr:ankyrin repeat domain-containing protein, putative [Perkinsus marinus ATCC 50983]EER16448.1 ankyrin repeat domain-containing protein, putative [Perkinsus marinus ATCC 50983]|eukprot:XP_002784652.1 ankyrin repeat domain-containing protein, putative [Perkinsus marinus ATCC 50983]
MLVEAMTEQGWSSVVQKLFKSHDLVRVHWNVEDEVSALQDGLTLLIVCAQFDNAAMMEWLRLTGGMFIDEKDHSGRTALHWAAYKVSGNGHRKSVQWLLSRGASLIERDIDGMTPLHLASMQGHKMVGSSIHHTSFDMIIKSWTSDSFSFN